MMATEAEEVQINPLSEASDSGILRTMKDRLSSFLQRKSGCSSPCTPTEEKTVQVDITEESCPYEIEEISSDGSQESEERKASKKVEEDSKNAFVRKCLPNVVVTIQNHRFLAHRKLLARRSQYFADLLHHEIPDCPQEITEITFDDITPNAFKLLLNYYYGNGLHLTIDCVCDVLDAAKKLENKELVVTCDDFLNGLLSVNSVLDTYQKAREEGLLELQNRSRSVIGKNFKTISNTISFLKLPVDVLCEILSNSNVQVRSEIDVFNAALQWLEYDRKVRMRCMYCVMKCIRFSTMLLEELNQCLEDAPFLMENLQTRDLVLNAHWYKTCMTMKIPTRAKFIPVLPTRKFKLPEGVPRKPVPEMITAPKPEYVPPPLSTIALIGGLFTDDWDPQRRGKYFLAYDTKTDEWTQRPSLPEGFNFHGVASLGTVIFLIGGIKVGERGKLPVSDPVPLSIGYKFDTQTQLWSRITNMCSARMHHECVAINGKIYAIGGQNEKREILTSVERYDPSLNMWTTVAPLKQQRLGFAVAAYHNRIFVVGGLGDPVRKCGVPVLSMVEVYSPRKNRWNIRNNLEVPRCYASLCVANDSLFLIGGATAVAAENINLKNEPSVDIYYEDTDCWEFLIPMPHSRRRCSVVSVESYIYVFGGAASENTRECVADVDCFDAKHHKWVENKVQIPRPLFGAKVALLDDSDQLAPFHAFSRQ